MITEKEFAHSLNRIYSQEPELNSLPLEDILAPIPRIDQLQLPAGTRVMIRCDLDVPLKDGAVADPSRLEAIAHSVTYAVGQRWTPILFGHLGREPQNSLKPVASALGDLLGVDIDFVPDWIREDGAGLSDSFRDNVAKYAAGQVVMLENTRKYDVERTMWKLSPDEFDSAAGNLYELAADIYERVSTVFVNEALAASNFDFSSAVLPLVMDKVAYGFYLHREMTEHIKGARESQLVVFSGLKIDKLNDLEKIIERGKLKMIISAGSLAMALKKAQAQLAGGDFSLGLAEEDSGAKFYLEPSRIEQAKVMLKNCQRQDIEVVLPLDFILNDGAVSDNIPSGKSQMDIGLKSRKLFSEKLASFGSSVVSPTLFYNGVFGKFEEERFAGGAKDFIAQLKKATESGVRTYVGGGEGRMALLRYGSLADVTHCFTAGGTILKSLGNKHIAYVKASFLQSQTQRAGAMR
jgi:phosphoglycerate kinase